VVVVWPDCHGGLVKVAAAVLAVEVMALDAEFRVLVRVSLTLWAAAVRVCSVSWAAVFKA
jgi:hypothetical protein